MLEDSKIELAIKVKKLGKVYSLNPLGISGFIESLEIKFLQNIIKSKRIPFVALENIDFELKKGDSLAIIGKNGAGKSTLLKLLTGIGKPTHGKIEVNGKINSILELGSGFNPDFTGIENIIMNAHILGYSDFEIKGKIQEIEDFAEIGHFINQPVKQYSSGMYVRLAFAVQALLDPEILIIDEALSVGDIFFAQKCHKFIEDLLQSKKVTFVFVSHDPTSILRYCRLGLVLDQGRQVFFGDSKDALEIYYKDSKRIISDESKITPDNLNQGIKLNEGNYKIDYISPESCIIPELFLNLDNSTNNLIILSSQWIHLECRIKFLKNIGIPIFYFGVFNEKNLEIFAINSEHKEIEIQEVVPGSEFKVSIRVKLSVQIGIYSLVLSVNSCSGAIYSKKNEMNYNDFIDKQMVLVSLKIAPLYITNQLNSKRLDFYGLVNLEHDLKVSAVT